MAAEGGPKNHQWFSISGFGQKAADTVFSVSGFGQQATRFSIAHNCFDLRIWTALVQTTCFRLVDCFGFTHQRIPLTELEVANGILTNLCLP